MEIHPSPSGRLPQAGGQQGEQEGVIGVAAPDAFELPGRFEQTEQAFPGQGLERAAAASGAMERPSPPAAQHEGRPGTPA